MTSSQFLSSQTQVLLSETLKHAQACLRLVTPDSAFHGLGLQVCPSTTPRFQVQFDVVAIPAGMLGELDSIMLESA